MRTSLICVFALILLSNCNEGDSSCTTSATVRDLTGLDGCRFIFELEDGTRLEPQGNPSDAPGSKNPEDPLTGFNFAEGKLVRIGYYESDNGSICMVGKPVRITCLQEISVSVTAQ